jgi:AraC-like DNA-binding protein
VEAFSTATVHKNEKVDYWQCLCSETYADLELDPLDHRNFEGTLYRAAGGPLSFAHVSSSAARITRSEEHFVHPAGHRYHIFLTLEGQSLCIHGGRQAVLCTGDFTLVDISRPYHFEFEDFCSAVSIGMSESLICSYLPVPGELIGRPISGAFGVNRLAAVMIRCLCDQVQAGHVADLSSIPVRGVLDVVAAAYATALGAPPSDSAVAGARRIQIKTFIESHLRDPRLTPGQIAASIGISPRYLRLLFSQEEETISQYVTRRRLDEVAQQLADINWRTTTITDIAYGWGFSDAGHFARAFRQKFGVSPRDYRHTRIGRSH